MKKIFFLTALLALTTALHLSGQALVGVGFGFSKTPSAFFETEGADKESSGPAAQLRIHVPLKGKFGVIADGNYYLDGVKYATYWSVDLNATYKFVHQEKLDAYALAGFNVYTVTVPKLLTTPLLNFNLGAGATYAFKPRWAGLAELRFAPGFASHYMFSLGIALRLGDGEE